jgi:putative transposase
LGQFGENKTKAIAAYRQFVIKGKGVPDPKGQVRHQMFLGNEAFITEHQQAAEKPVNKCELSKAHKRSITLTLSDYQRGYSQRNEAMANAYLSGAYTIAEIGQHFKVHYYDCQSGSKKI